MHRCDAAGDGSAAASPAAGLRRLRGRPQRVWQHGRQHRARARQLALAQRAEPRVGVARVERYRHGLAPLPGSPPPPARPPRLPRRSELRVLKLLAKADPASSNRDCSRDLHICSRWGCLDVTGISAGSSLRMCDSLTLCLRHRSLAGRLTCASCSVASRRHTHVSGRLIVGRTSVCPTRLEELHATLVVSNLLVFTHLSLPL